MSAFRRILTHICRRHSKTLWQKDKVHIVISFFLCLNPFPHIDAFCRLCSGRLFVNIVTKEEMAQNEQFLLLPQCFSLLVVYYPFNNFLLQNCRMWKRDNVFNHIQYLHKHFNSCRSFMFSKSFRCRLVAC